MNLGQWIAIGLSAVLAVWYVVGATINRRRGVAIYHWLRSGLEKTGKITEARWIGSAASGARLVVGRAEKPFGRIEIVFLLDSREILPLWLVNLLRGKRDQIILKANLRSAPSEEIEVGRSGSREIKALLSQESGASYKPAPAPQGFEVVQRGISQTDKQNRLQTFLEQEGRAVIRMSLQRQTPHLILRLDLPPMREAPAEDFFIALTHVLSGG